MVVGDSIQTVTCCILKFLVGERTAFTLGQVSEAVVWWGQTWWPYLMSNGLCPMPLPELHPGITWEIAC